MPAAALGAAADEPTPELHIDAATAAGADDSSRAANPYMQMSLDELMNVQVTSVSGLKQSLFSTPAAMYLIVPHDIQQVGARSIPEALRMVPGLHVGRIDARRYAITSRGFNDVFANKLQVLIDGRSIYEPSFAGVYWDQHDTIMEDLQRIEVIRGPGATLWGANAVNGVINITTKSAKDTQGWLITGGGGTEERYFGQVRYGDQIDNDTWFRIWAKHSNRDSSYSPTTGGDADDQWDATYGGFRLDHEGADDALITAIVGVTATNNVHLSASEPVPNTQFGRRQHTYIGEIYDTYLLGRIDNHFDSDHGWKLQGYFEADHRAEFGNIEERQTTDLDFKYHLKADNVHDLLAGVEWRFSHTHIEPSATAEFAPNDRNFHLVTGFVQDTLTLVPDRWFALVGSKFEYNQFTGFECQPSARLWWTPNDHQTLWGSVSRAVRTPSVLERDIVITQTYGDLTPPPTGPYVPFQAFGNKDLKSEQLLAFELGYRQQFDNALLVDIATFANRYDDLIAFVPTSPTTSQYQNTGSAESYGVELAVSWQVNNRWSIDASYSYLKLFAHSGTPSSLEHDTPEHLFNIRSHYELNDQWQFNGALYFAGRRDGPSGPGYIPSAAYVRLDLGLTWKATPDLELSIWGQNLLDNHHMEYGDGTITGRPMEIDRGLYVQATYRF